MRSDPERSALLDIPHNIALAEDFVRDQSFDVFRDDLMRQYAVTRCLEIISEASRRLTDQLKRAILAFRGVKSPVPATCIGTITRMSRRRTSGTPCSDICRHFGPLWSRSWVRNPVRYPAATVWMTSKPSNSG
jgi:hypothetical protein